MNQGTDEREQRIAERITELWAHWGRASLEFELATGRAIIDGLHRGKVDGWRNRRKHQPSLRRISDLLGRVRSAPQLYYAACAYALAHNHPSVLTLEHLKASHLHAVAGLPEDKALELLERATRKKQSVRGLRNSVAEVRVRGKGGRPATREELRQLQQASRIELPSKDVDIVSLLKSFALEERLELASALLRVSCRCAELSAAIAAYGAARVPAYETNRECEFLIA